LEGRQNIRTAGYFKKVITVMDNFEAKGVYLKLSQEMSSFIKGFEY
jgi:hypothetical protein